VSSSANASPMLRGRADAPDSLEQSVPIPLSNREEASSLCESHGDRAGGVSVFFRVGITGEAREREGPGEVWVNPALWRVAVAATEDVRLELEPAVSGRTGEALAGTCRPCTRQRGGLSRQASPAQRIQPEDVAPGLIHLDLPVLSDRLGLEDMCAPGQIPNTKRQIAGGAHAGGASKSNNRSIACPSMSSSKTPYGCDQTSWRS